MDDEYYMHMALEEARLAADRGEVPIGAVVVYEPIDRATGKASGQPCAVGQAGNQREATNNPAAHAEFLALQQAAQKQDAWRLTDCTVYVTLEPCLMCAGLMQQARIRRCVFGAFDPKAGALGSLYNINSDTRLNHTFEVTTGVCANEASELLKNFFARRRK